MGSALAIDSLIPPESLGISFPAARRGCSFLLGAPTFAEPYCLVSYWWYRVRRRALADKSQRKGILASRRRAFQPSASMWKVKVSKTLTKGCLSSKLLASRNEFWHASCSTGLGCETTHANGLSLSNLIRYITASLPVHNTAYKEHCITHAYQHQLAFAMHCCTFRPLAFVRSALRSGRTTAPTHAPNSLSA